MDGGEDAEAAAPRGPGEDIEGEQAAPERSPGPRLLHGAAQIASAIGAVAGAEVAAEDLLGADGSLGVDVQVEAEVGAA